MTKERIKRVRFQVDVIVELTIRKLLIDGNDDPLKRITTYLLSAAELLIVGLRWSVHFISENGSLIKYYPMNGDK